MTATTILTTNDALELERTFSFNKQNVPDKILSLLTEIEHNKRKWKSLYMAVWGLPLHFLEPGPIKAGKGDEIINWELPAAKLKKVQYTPNELKNYLTSYDDEIHISQLIKIFTLLENYFFEYYDLNKNEESLIQKFLKQFLNSRFVKHLAKKNRKLKSMVDKTKNKLRIQQKDFTYFYILKKYLKENNFADGKELLELEYAKETRNSYIHRRGLVNRRWLKIHKKTGRNNKISLNDRIPLKFHDLEEWTDIMIEIIKKSLKKYNDV